MNIVFKIKQYIKMFIQNKYLPHVYDRAVRNTKVDPNLIILADMHSDKLPFSMEAVFDELVSRGKIPTVYCGDIGKMSLLKGFIFMRRFMKLYASARYVYICSYFLPVSSCRKRKETKVIQLWHSGGLLKKMGYDTKDDIPKDYKGNVTANYDLVTVSAPVCVPVWERALGLPMGITEPIGISRTDYYYKTRWNAKAKRKFEKYYPEAKGKKVAVYAPSFSGNAAFPECKGLDMHIERAFKDNPDWCLIVRPHPHMKKKYPEYFDERFKRVATEEVLVSADLLITDYSSILFDYICFRKPFVMFCPDIEKYRRDRGFYEDPEHFPGPFVRTVDELRQVIDDEKYKDCGQEELEAFFHNYMGACDGHVTERLLDLVEKL